MKPEPGWDLISNNPDDTLGPTGIVHHRSGCNASNGRNKLYSIDLNTIRAERLARWRKCQNCERILEQRAR